MCRLEFYRSACGWNSVRVKPEVSTSQKPSHRKILIWQYPYTQGGEVLRCHLETDFKEVKSAASKPSMWLSVKGALLLFFEGFAEAFSSGRFNVFVDFV
jgi:hypothetical protein